MAQSCFNLTFFCYWQFHRENEIKKENKYTILPTSVRVAPAVMSAAVRSPAVSAAAAFRPPARVSRVVESVSLSTVVRGVLVSVAAIAVAVATSSPKAPSAASGVAAPQAATAESPLLPALTPGGPAGHSLFLTAVIPPSFPVHPVVQAEGR